MNDALAKNLGIKKIEVEDRSTTQKVDVRLSYISHAGNRVNRLAGNSNFYKAMGLMI